MSDSVIFAIDDVTVESRPGQTILQAATEAGIYIPHLCASKDLTPHGSCRVCTVMVNGRPTPACIQPVVAGAVIENNAPQVNELRRQLVEMLLVEGNHFCMFCEKSGNCELQAMAYRLGILAPRYSYFFPRRELDAGHPEFMIDLNRCILCGRCVRASRELDRKNVFGFVGRGEHKRVAVNARVGLSQTDVAATDRVLQMCPVGAIVKKRVGYAVPIGERRFDRRPIGSEIETRQASGEE